MTTNIEIPVHPIEFPADLPVLPIKLPDGWTEQDDLYFLSSFAGFPGRAPTKDPTDTATTSTTVCSLDREDHARLMLWQIGNNCRDLQAVLDNSVAYYAGRLGLSRLELIGTLTPFEKIKWLQTLIQVDSSYADYLKLMANGLSVCWAVEVERQRVLATYRAPDDKPWLFPLCQLSKCLVAAGKEFELCVTTCCEEDYNQPIVFR